MDMKEVFTSLVRHGLTIGGGFLVSQGYFEAAQAETLIGAAMTIFGVAWAIYSKKKAA